MIVTLSDQFDEFSAEEWLPYIPAIENILIAHVQGWHMFVPSRAVAKTLCGLPQLSEQHRSVLSVQIAQKLATLTGQAKSVAKTMRCLSHEEEPANDDRAREVPLTDLANLEFCFKSKLIVENGQSDGRFYLLAARLMANLDFSITPLAIDVVSGGGATTANLVVDAVQSPRPSLTIVDGDRRLPAGPEGDTARQVRAAFENNQYFTNLLHVTAVKAVENLIPLFEEPDFLEGRLESLTVYDAVHTQTRAEIEAGVDEEHRVISYYCFKRGFKVAHARVAAGVFRSNLMQFATRLGISTAVPAHNDNSSDNQVFVPGVNNRFADLFISKVDSDPNFASKVKVNLVESASTQLRQIVDDVIAFGFAPRRLPILLNSAA